MINQLTCRPRPVATAKPVAPLTPATPATPVTPVTPAVVSGALGLCHDMDDRFGLNQQKYFRYTYKQQLMGMKWGCSGGILQTTLSLGVFEHWDSTRINYASWIFDYGKCKYHETYHH